MEGFNMKRKFLSIVSLFLAVMMILPMGVFVSATDGIQIYHGTELVSGTTVTLKGVNAFNSGDTYELTVKNAAEGDVTWYSLDPSVASVDKRSGVVTLLKTGTAEVRVEDSAKNEASVTFDIELNECNGIRVAEDYKKEYYSGQTFDVSSLTVYEVYKDGSEKKVTSGYSVEPSGRLTADVKEVKVNYGGKYSDPLPITVKEIAVESIKIKYVKTEFTEGEKLPEIEVEVTYNDGSKVTIVDGYDVYVNDSQVSSSYTFKEGDTSIKVSYNGKTSDSIGIKVTKKTNDPVNDGTYTVEMGTPPTKKEYRVGDKFSKIGMTASVYQNVNGNKVKLNSTDVALSYDDYTITEADLKNKTFITLSVTITIKTGTNAGKKYSSTLTVTGLTIKEAASALDVYEITDVEMVENSYPVGYKFAVDDVDYFKYKEKGGRTEYKVSGYDMLHSYTNNFDLEVLTNKNDKATVKSSRYMYTLEEGDIFTDTKRDTQYAYLRLTVDKETYDFTVKVGGSGVYYYYDSDLIETYDDIDEAIKYTMEQDKNLKDFDLDKVKDSKDITLKLGEDQKVSTKTDFELCHNVTIDLAGHKLDFYTDTVDIIKANRDYTLTITNTSSTSAKFTYVDEEVEITLAKGDKIVFEYDKDIPGIYTITLDIDTNGKVTTTPAADKNDTVKVGQGSDVKFTITPSTDYELDTIKLDTKTVAEKDYTKSSTGVVTYTLKSVTKSQKVTVTFKKSNTTKNWNNPFTDVSATDSYYSAVKFVYENNLFKGTTTTKFGPDTTMTRAMFVTVLGRLAGVDVSRFKTSSYSDVPINATTTWYAPYVEWATQMGLVEGYGDGTFGPDNKITHQQMYVLMYKYSIFVENKKTNISGTSINASDAEEVADWAKDAVKYASQQNFLVKVGTSSRINPTGEAKRSELAQLLEKYCDVVLDWNSSNK